ncbi:MAG: type II toxin-antitoxin system prevent-host-death family antitoxin [Terrimicrobiaceae bacterium]
MKEIPTSRTTDGEPLIPSPVLREVAVMPGLGETISVRAAKAHLSALLGLVEKGREIVITSSGKPKAKLTSVKVHKARKVFPGSREHLATMPAWDGGPTAEEIIRADRDGRGW